MRAWVYTPVEPVTITNWDKNYIDADRTEVDVESIDALLEELLKIAPERTRVVAFGEGVTTHYVLGRQGFERKLLVVL